MKDEIVDIITESLIKGIIVTYSRTGITTSKIANVFYECVGENWPLNGKGEEHAIRYLEKIEGVLSILDEKNELLWYVRGKTLPNGEKRGQIYRASHPHGNAHNTCTRNNNNNNDDCRNARNNNNNTNWSKVDRNNNRCDGDINGNHDPRNGKPQSYSTNNRWRWNGGSFGSHHSSDSGVTSSCNEHKSSASLYSFDLVGDDFFLEMATIDLGCSFMNRKRIRRSGMCISGQSIRDATERIKRYPHPDNMKIIANLGTVDILHGRDLADMCQDYINLIQVCHERCIEIVITTLAPIGNRLHSRIDVQKLHEFNEFLVNRLSKKFLVIDIQQCMTCPITGKILFECYQAHPKLMSGTNQAHLLWNRIGRQRVLKAIKAQIRL